MENFKNSDVKYLKGLAHKLKPIFIVGQNGVTGTLIKGVNEALDHHELLKIKFNDHKEEKKPLAEEIAGKTKAYFVGMIGNVAILYRQQEDEGKRKIEIPT